MIGIYVEGGYHIIKEEDIICLSGDGNYCYIYTDAQKPPFLVCKKLSEINEVLGSDFVKAHQSFVVNKNKMERVFKEKNNWKIKLTNKKIIPISQKHKQGVFDTFIKI